MECKERTKKDAPSFFIFCCSAVLSKLSHIDLDFQLRKFATKRATKEQHARPERTTAELTPNEP